MKTNNPTGHASRAAILLAAGLVALSGCASVRGGGINTSGYRMAEDFAGLSLSQQAQVSYRLESAYLARPGRLNSGIEYSEYLKATGDYKKANEVMRQVAALNPGSGEAQLFYARSQAALGYYPDALRTVRQAAALSPNDWRVYNEEGTILDQMGQPMEARMRYRKALSLSPSNPDVLSAMATSYVLTHDLPTAENYLREADQQRNAGSDVRVNLGLVLALQGKQEEAQRVVTAGVSPEEAQQNLAALAAATAPGGAWEQYAVGM